jgi:hypothetical protein
MMMRVQPLDVNDMVGVRRVDEGVEFF